MSANDMSERVDFKDVLNASAKRLRLGVAGPKNADQLEGIAVAVAELVEADREFDSAWDAHGDLNRDELDSQDAIDAALARIDLAESRRAAALARFNTP